MLPSVCSQSSLDAPPLDDELLELDELELDELLELEELLLDDELELEELLLDDELELEELLLDDDELPPTIPNGLGCAAQVTGATQL
jgi:hypothetical protein